MDAGLLNGLLGAGAALAGVLLSQVVAVLQAHLDRKHQRRLLLRSKYEAMVEHLNESLAWAHTLLDQTEFRTTQTPALAAKSSSAKSSIQGHHEKHPLAARRVYALCLLYFPLLEQAAGDYLVSCIAYETVITSAHHNTDSAKTESIAMAAGNASKDMQSARQTLDKMIQLHADRYT